MNRDELKKELAEIAAIVKQFPESIQARVFELLIHDFAALPSPLHEQKTTPRPEHAIATKKASAPSSIARERKPKRAAAKESYSIDRNLDLRGGKSTPSFASFVSEKAPTSAKEFNAVAVYYLVKLLGIEAATLNQAYTCYSEAKKKPPEHFRQSFTDTKNKEGWVEFDEHGLLKIPHRGVVFVEHDLPRQSAPKK